jgi:hypothetical protein
MLITRTRWARLRPALFEPRELRVMAGESLGSFESKLGICESALSPQLRKIFGLAAEGTFVSGDARGWRAAAPGSQTIRLSFDEPQTLRRISLIFEENETGRTQAFVLRWSPDGGNLFKEIERQQWNFSPPGTVREVEEYQVALSNVTVLELIIKPNIGGGLARASLKNLRLS